MISLEMRCFDIHKMKKCCLIAVTVFVFLFPINSVFADGFPHIIYAIDELMQELAHAEGNGGFISQLLSPFRSVYVILKGVVVQIPVSILLDIEALIRVLNNFGAATGLHRVL